VRSIQLPGQLSVASLGKYVGRGVGQYFRSLGWYSGLESFMVILPLLLGGYNSSLRQVDDAKLSIAIGVAVWVARIRRRLLLG
jgi:hypothetical protein